MENYPNISSFMELNRISKQLNYSALTRQMQQFMSMLKSALPFKDYNALLDKTPSLKNSSITPKRARR